MFASTSLTVIGEPVITGVLLLEKVVLVHLIECEIARSRIALPKR